MGDRDRGVEDHRRVAFLGRGAAWIRHLGEIEERLIDAKRLHRGGEALQYVEELKRRVDVLLGITLDEDRVRAEPLCLRHGHPGVNPERARRVVRRGDDTAPLRATDEDRLPLEAWVQLLLDR